MQATSPDAMRIDLLTAIGKTFRRRRMKVGDMLRSAALANTRRIRISHRGPGRSLSSFQSQSEALSDQAQPAGFLQNATSPIGARKNAIANAVLGRGHWEAGQDVGTHVS